MMRMDIKITGIKQIEKKLSGMETKIARKVVRQALKKAAKPILAAAKRNAPVKTGALKKSLRVRVMKKKKHRYGVMVATSAKWFTGETFYAAFVEYGTKHLPARPFLRPAMDSQKTAAEKILKQEILSGIEKIGAK